MTTLIRIFSTLGILAIFSLPVCASALSPSAGFPRDLIWFSSDGFFAGDAITVFTTVYNSTPDRFTGQVTLFDGTQPIGTQSFSLPPHGSSATLAFPWVATKGEHAFSVKVTSGEFSSGKTALSDFSSNAVSTNPIKRTVGVKKSVAPTPPVTKTVPTSEDIETGTSTPIDAPLSKNTFPVIGTIENVRQSQAEKSEANILALQEEISNDGLPVGIVDALLLTTTPEGRDVLRGGGESVGMIFTPWQYVKLFFYYCYHFLLTHAYVFYVALLLFAYKIIRAVIGLVT